MARAKSNSQFPYDETSPSSILEYAKKLEGQSLKSFFEGNLEQIYSGKGKLGQILEKEFFKYEINSDARPDFDKAGVELKSTPMRKKRDGNLTSKERLVLNIINYMTEWDKSFRDSSFWHKNAKILLMFYLWEEGKMDIDYIFKFVRLWEFPAEDLKIIKDDWETIMRKIRLGKAHEITEGDTFYLAACMKGASKEQSQREQPFSDQKAVQRAYSLKNVYMNYIIDLCERNVEIHINQKDIDYVLDEWTSSIVRDDSGDVVDYKWDLRESEPILKSVQNIPKGKSFADYVVGLMSPYFGMTITEIEDELNLPHSAAKNRFAISTSAMLGCKTEKQKFTEFIKGNVEVKTIRLEKTGNLKEAMSFAQIKFKEIIDEEWETSYWYETLLKKFFFVVFQANADDDYVLKNAFFWNMPYSDLVLAKEYWLDTQKKISEGDYEHFLKSSQHPICHVRPKATNSLDLMETPQGTLEKKKCYWLNRAYIKNIIDVNQIQSIEKFDYNIDGTNYVLIAYCQSNKHFEWYMKMSVYNVRAGESHGAINISRETQLARYLFLFGPNKEIRGVYELDADGPKRFSKSDLVLMNYPSVPSAQSYYLYRIVGQVHELDSHLEALKNKIPKGRFMQPFAVKVSDL